MATVARAYSGGDHSRAIFVRHPCKVCGTWKCHACGARRTRSNRFSGQPQRCPTCKSHDGEMQVTQHQLYSIQVSHDEHYEQLIAEGYADKLRYPVETAEVHG